MHELEEIDSQQAECVNHGALVDYYPLEIHETTYHNYVVLKHQPTDFN